jgi:hypothetical protein
MTTRPSIIRAQLLRTSVKSVQRMMAIRRPSKRSSPNVPRGSSTHSTYCG